MVWLLFAVLLISACNGALREHPNHIKSVWFDSNSNCTVGAIDIVFVMDESGSITPQNYYEALEAMANMTRSFKVGSTVNDSHVGFVLFDDQGHLGFLLDTYLTNDAVYNAIRALSYSAGGTDIASGMATAINQVFVPPGNRPTVRNIMIVITDGVDNSNVTAQHQAAVAKNITTYALGVGGGVDLAQLALVTGDPSKVFNVSDYGQISQVLGTICNEIATTAKPPSTTPSVVDNNGTNTERDCACTHKNIWLDITLVFESTRAMTQSGLLDISATMVDVVDDMTISQTIDQSSRVGVVVFSETAQTLSSLSTFTNSGDLENQLLSLSSSYYSATTNPDLKSGLQAAIGLYNGPGNRRYARNVIVLIASSYQTGTEHDVLQLADQFRQSNGVIIVLRYQQPGQAAIDSICEIASPGMCFTNVNSSETEFNNIMKAFCIANCFCKAGDRHFIAGTSTNPLVYGTCIRPVNTGATWNTADRVCALAPHNGRLAQIYNQDKLTFLTNVSITNLQTDRSWVGLKYYADQNPSDWYWKTMSGTLSPIAGTPSEAFWSPTPQQPILSNGECVMLSRLTGFTLRLYSAPCSNSTHASLFYMCQYDACDTDKFCPDIEQDTGMPISPGI